MNFNTLMDKIQNGNYGQANYQLVAICHLSQSVDLRDSKKNIAQKLAQKNKAMKKDNSFFMSVPVYKVLTKKGIISKIQDGYKLTTKLTKSEQAKIKKICMELLK